MSFDSYNDAGTFVAVDLANALAHGDLDVLGLKVVLARDPRSVADLTDADTAGFASLATTLSDVLEAFVAANVDTAAGALNVALEAAPTRPHLALEDGQWRLHHHPRTTKLVPMWTAICAEALARALASGLATRIGRCEDNDCRDFFVDTSRNATRRFCSTRCQNRAKVRAFRERRAAVV